MMDDVIGTSIHRQMQKYPSQKTGTEVISLRGNESAVLE